MPNTTTSTLAPARRRELEKCGERIARLGVNFAVVTADGQIPVLVGAGLFESHPEQLAHAGRCVLGRIEDQRYDGPDIPLWQFNEGNSLVAAPLLMPLVIGGYRHPVGALVIDMGDPSARAGTPGQDVACFSEMLRLIALSHQTTIRTEEQIETVGVELSRVYEELVLLHRISTNMRVTESDTNFLQLACDSLTDIILVEGIAVLLERVVEGDRRFVVAAGSGLIDIDETLAMTLHSRLAEQIAEGGEALLDSEVDSPFRYNWPASVRSIIAVPLCVKDKGEGGSTRRTKGNVSIIGLMVAINRIDKPDFDSTDIKLFNSVASGCAVFIENGRLFNDLKELFVGSLKALTNSIDAKDQYTRGHSERVALISRWIAERLAEREPLEEEQIHTIYLAGLLHDIGKIGIDEAVLRKNGKLTPEERACIQWHPSIGAGILRGIKQMRDIVPGVLCHHERVDGKGYPDGLLGDEIPLTGKIVQLADSFDAMTSKRVYRDAMSVERALDEIRKGLGAQFDEHIGRLFLESDVQRLWEMIQDGGAEGGDAAHFADYGTEAVGTLLR
ncbi:MAG TPA: HD domain-containing protein [Sedimentisphaerales bacterium]|jgi:HD-GYP domain-containing protein (c-di-GMP phosphodiesterase class II)|nr:HD domain-containing protein [Sedimentisphaerales bacterium]HNU28094.1 HD domain-containing protein [Sedimentisphaerales bacterium]